MTQQDFAVRPPRLSPVTRATMDAALQSSDLHTAILGAVYASGLSDEIEPIDAVATTTYFYLLVSPDNTLVAVIEHIDPKDPDNEPLARIQIDVDHHFFADADAAELRKVYQQYTPTTMAIQVMFRDLRATGMGGLIATHARRSGTVANLKEDDIRYWAVDGGDTLAVEHIRPADGAVTMIYIDVTVDNFGRSNVSTIRSVCRLTTRPSDTAVAGMDQALRASTVLPFTRLLERFTALIVTGELDPDNVEIWIEYGNPPRIGARDPISNRTYYAEVLATGPDTSQNHRRFQPHEIDELVGIHAAHQD